MRFQYDRMRYLTQACSFESGRTTHTAIDKHRLVVDFQRYSQESRVKRDRHSTPFFTTEGTVSSDAIQLASVPPYRSHSIMMAQIADL